MSNRSPENCVSILRPFFDKYSRTKKVQIIGGVGAAALTDPASHLDAHNKLITASPDFYLPSMRENGTRRDVDVFVRSLRPDYIKRVEDDLKTTVDGRLDVSVFGIRPNDRLLAAMKNPMGGSALLSFLSDRYDNPADRGYVKALFPFSVPISPASLKPWRVTVAGSSFHVPHPALSVINYANRSISGVRAKDERKVAASVDRLRCEAPSAIDWLFDGPGASQLELARVIHSAGAGIEPLERALGTSLPQIGQDELMEHPAFMLRRDSTAVKKTALGAFAAKAKVLRTFESSPMVRKIWQQVFERGVAASIIENS